MAKDSQMDGKNANKGGNFNASTADNGNNNSKKQSGGKKKSKGK